MVLDWLGGAKDADALMARRKYPQAIEALRQLLQKHGGDLRLRMKLADALVLAGREKEARSEERFSRNAENQMSKTSMREALRESASEAKESAAENAGSDTAADIRAHFEALRNDVLRLLSEVLGSKGSAGWEHARSNVESVVSDAAAKGQDAVDAMRDVGENVLKAVDESLRKRPYTTLALAAAVGFFLGATWRR